MSRFCESDSVCLRLFQQYYRHLQPHGPEPTQRGTALALLVRRRIRCVATEVETLSWRGHFCKYWHSARAGCVRNDMPARELNQYHTHTTPGMSKAIKRPRAFQQFWFGYRSNDLTKLIGGMHTQPDNSCEGQRHCALFSQNRIPQIRYASRLVVTGQ